MFSIILTSHLMHYDLSEESRIQCTMKPRQLRTSLCTLLDSHSGYFQGSKKSKMTGCRQGSSLAQGTYPFIKVDRKKKVRQKYINMQQLC